MRTSNPERTWSKACTAERRPVLRRPVLRSLSAAQQPRRTPRVSKFANAESNCGPGTGPVSLQRTPPVNEWVAASSQGSSSAGRRGRLATWPPPPTRRVRHRRPCGSRWHASPSRRRFGLRGSSRRAARWRSSAGRRRRAGCGRCRVGRHRRPESWRRG
jgi:hypothetical protein